MAQGTDFEHWTLRDLQDVLVRVQRLQLQLGAVSMRCTDRRVRKRAFTAVY